MDIQGEAFERLVIAEAMRIQSNQFLSPGKRAVTGNEGLPEKDEETVRKSEELLKDPSIRERLCPGLRTIADDLREIAKVVAAALLPLALAPQAAIPLSPVIFGGIAVVILRTGIHSLCPPPGK